jgi:CRISPR-associated protein Cmr1
LIAPVDQEQEVREVVRAWLLFGGYGSRTRRGLGSLCVVDDARTWLPASASRDAITAVFGRDIFAPTGAAAIETPCFASAALHVGTPPRDAMSAWTTALDWLKEFRQGTKGKEGDRAREPGTGKNQPRRPSISNWPEADKIRHLARRTRAHPPRHNQTPAWPRAGFGLPIIGQFQTRGRNGERLDEPGPFELRWRSGNEEHDRLTSPLIVKAFPLADGTFAPCALWLNRAYPNGDVILKGVANSAAPFDRLVAEGDTPRFSALAGKAGLREVFLDWLHEKHNTTVVAP